MKYKFLHLQNIWFNGVIKLSVFQRLIWVNLKLTSKVNCKCINRGNENGRLNVQYKSAIQKKKSYLHLYFLLWKAHPYYLGQDALVWLLSA